MKTKLLGSASSLEQLKDGIQKFFYSSNIVLNGNDKDGYTISNSKGVIEGVKVVLKGKRYRFEMEGF